MMMKTGTSRGHRRVPLLVGGLVLSALVTTALLLPGDGVLAQEHPVLGSAVTMSSSEATLDLELATGETRSISLRNGSVFVDGAVRGSYEPGGALETAWRDLLRDPAVLDAGSVDDLLLAWSPPDGSASGSALLDALAFLTPAEVEPAQAADELLMGDLGDGGVAIAPGIRSLDHLTRSMEQLHRSLARIGSHALVSGEDVALVIHDDYSVGAGQIIDGDLAMLDGDVLLEGTIRGDAIMLDGTLTLAEGARIEGDLLQVGGEVLREGGTVAGEMVSVNFALEELAAELETLDDLDVRVDALDVDVRVSPRHERPGFFGRIGHNIGHAIGGLAGVLAWWIGLGAFGAGLVYFFRKRLEVVADTARLNLSRSFGVGLAGELLFVPIGLVLVVGIITWLVIPFYVLAAAIAIPAAYLAVAHATGEVFEGQRYEWVERLQLNRSNSYWYVWIGLAVLLAPFAFGSALYLLGGFLGFIRGLLFFAGGVITWAAITTGLGAILLSRGGSSRQYAEGAIPDLFSDLEDFPAEAPNA
jgi:hypothetical protein